MIVGVHYIQHGTNVTEDLLAELPGHADDPGSIRMRLQNFQYLATYGEAGLSEYTKSTEAAYKALLPNILFHEAIKAMTQEGFTGHEMAIHMHLPDEWRGVLIQCCEQD
jgi:hypothetical protein